MLHQATRVKVNATTSGLTDFGLGAAVNLSFHSFPDAGVPDQSLIDYTAVTSTQFECGTGVYDDGGTLTRVDIYASSNAGAKVNFTSNPVVFSTYLPHRLLQRNIDYLDIHDFATKLLDDPYSDITDALNAAMEWGDGNNLRRIRISPYVSIAGVVNSNLALYDAIVWPAQVQGETAWIIEFDINNLLVGTTITPPRAASLVGLNREESTGVGINGPNMCHISTYAPGQTQHPATVFCDPIVFWDVPKLRMENIVLHNGNGGCCVMEGTELGLVRNCGFGSGGGSNPALIIDGGFWITLENIAASATAADFSMDILHSGVGASLGLLRINDLRLGSAGLRFYGTAGFVADTYIGEIISEDIRAGHSLVTFQGSVGQIKFERPIGGNADPIDIADNWIFNVVPGATVNGVSVCVTAATGDDLVLFKPGSGSVREFHIDSTLPTPQDTTAPRLESNNIGTAHHHNYRISYPSAEDVKLLTAPVTPNLVMGHVLPISQDSSTWTKLGGTDLTTGIVGPDGTTNAVLIPANASYRIYYVNDQPFTTNDWILIGCWQQMPGTTFAAKVVNFPINFEFEGVSHLNSGAGGDLAVCNEDFVVDHGWRFLCKAYKVTEPGYAATQPVVKMVLGDGTAEDAHIFMPCGVVLGQVKDRWALNVARSLKNSWSSTLTTKGTWGALDHQALYGGQGLMLKDGVTAPSTHTGIAQIYIDTADGDLKIKYGDGTVKTIVVDT